MNCLDCKYCNSSPIDSLYWCANRANESKLLGLGNGPVLSTEWWMSDQETPKTPSCGGVLFEKGWWLQKVLRGRHGGLWAALITAVGTAVVATFLAPFC